MGKAGDVVKIKLCNDATINHKDNPNVIFDILKHHFSEVNYSNMPLADFYNTLPMPNEDVMEYWIRLNKTMDVVCECLKRQGRSIGDPSHEVTMMFINHCPDQSLASVFKFKSADKWSASEIQERLDEYIQEKKIKATVTSHRLNMGERKVHSQSYMPMVDNVALLNSAQSPVPSIVSTAQSSLDNACLKSLVGLLDRLVTQQTQIPVNPCNQPVASQTPRRACGVCGDSNHSTLSHCRRENRCLRCLVPGHWKKDCPQKSNHHRSQPNSSSGGQNLQLN
ncbi:hypothetical protein LDENG_00105420 [Lucifuga dentata]|nr:hypothetical protein LDENG_00105420 [Lucifuga dentata]